MWSRKSGYYNTIMSIIVALIIGGIAIAIMGHNPFEAYIQLFQGAFVGKFNFGGTIEKFVPLMLAGLAFAVSSKVRVFNVGVEGQLYLGAMGAAWVGFTFTNLPKIIHVPFAMIVAMIVGALWAAIPGILKAYYRVNEVLTTILLNYVAIYLTSYLVNYPFSGGTGVAQSPPIAKTAELSKILKPSRASTGLFIAIAVVIFIYWLFYKTTVGYKLRSVGLNPDFTEYIGTNPKRAMVSGMMISGSIGGLAGAIEVMGIYGLFLDNFSQGIGFDGMLAALIAKSNFVLVPVLSFFIAALKSGALSMERYTGVPKSLIDAIIAVFILFATMEGLFKLRKKLKNKKEAEENVG
ncbi:ABC transporter permease [Senegalia massiliensis]|uniref:ABC transporter permease n=1 Tax=Senegalia massiliensis TaxID=1720316 RepID=A0A845QXX2_9CLOT|nr:ABC transporter permease [Senegalia massiliensis]NBI07111.1 ABC transporter permease [Senegalia massiliensis]